MSSKAAGGKKARRKDAEPDRAELIRKLKALRAKLRQVRREAKSASAEYEQRYEELRASLHGRLKALRVQHREQLSARKQEERSRIDALKQHFRQKTAGRAANERDIRARIKHASDERAQILRDAYTRMAPIRRILEFARACIDRAEELRADVYVAHEVLPLTAMHMLADRSGGKRFCNAVEYPSFRHRAVPQRWPEDVLAVVDAISDGGLARCDTLLTTGQALAAVLSRYHAPVCVIENFRHREKLRPSEALRDRCGLRSGDRLLLSIGHLATGVDQILEALALLPETIHLASLGPFVPSAYEDKMREMADRLGIGGRVHFLPSVPYAELTGLASGADCGVIPRETALFNNAVSFPNRVFDFTAAGLPIVAPDIPDIAAFLERHGHGRVVPEPAPETWAAAIEATLAEGERLKSKALAAAEKATWESIEPRLLEAFGDAQSVTFLGVGDLAKNNRTRRMARSLAGSGIRVKIAAWALTRPSEFEHEGITFHTLGN